MHRLTRARAAHLANRTALRWAACAVVLSAAVTLAASVSRCAAGAEDKPLFPLKRGLKWVYACKQKSNPPRPEDAREGRMTVEVGDVVVFNGTACHELIATADNDRRYRVIEYYAIKDGYVCHFGTKQGSDGEEATVHVYKPYQRLCKLTPGEPVSWTTAFDMIDPVQTEKIRKHVKTYDGRTPCRYACTQTPDKASYAGADHEAVLVVSVGSIGGGNDERKSRDWYVPGVGPVRREIPLTDGTVVTRQLVAFNGGGAVAVGAVEVRPAEVEKEASVEWVEAPAGVTTEFKKSRTITREVSWSVKAGLGFEAESKLAIDLAAVRGEVSKKVKASVEAALGEKLTDSETREQTVKIDGTVLPKARVVWIDVYRTGTVEVTRDGRTYKIPFEFPVGTKLVIRKP